MGEQHPVTRAIRDSVDAHEPALHMTQWYVDEHVIDCGADEFWEVVDKAVRASVTGWAQNTSDAAPTLRSDSVIEVHDPS